MTAMFFLYQKLSVKPYFIFKLTSPAMVQPASTDKWKAPQVLIIGSVNFE